MKRPEGRSKDDKQSRLYTILQLAYYDRWESEEAQEDAEAFLEEIVDLCERATEVLNRPGPYFDPEEGIELAKRLDALHQAISEEDVSYKDIRPDRYV